MELSIAPAKPRLTGDGIFSGAQLSKNLRLDKLKRSGQKWEMEFANIHQSNHVT